MEDLEILFEELLADYEDSESACIDEYSSNTSASYKNLGIKLNNYRKRFHQIKEDLNE